MRPAQDVAAELAQRHARRERFTSVLEGEEASDVSFAYAVQDSYVRGLCGASRSTPSGYKIGLTTARMQQMCGVDEPICGVVLDDRMLRSPASVRCADYVRLCIECEIAVQVGPGVLAASADRAPGPADMVEQVCAAFELVEDSGADYRRLSAASIVADNSWNAGLVLGQAVPGSECRGLAQRAGVLTRDGEKLDEGSSSDVLGDPWNAVLWLAGHLRERGRRLEPYQWVSTGSVVPTVFVSPGERYRFEVEGLPPVELEVI